MIYLVFSQCMPGTASMNRFNGLIRGFIKIGCDFRVVLICPNKNYSEIDPDLMEYTHNLWIKKPSKNKIINYCFWVLQKLVICSLNWGGFVKKLTDKDVVYLYNSYRAGHYLITARTGARVYWERTEHPYAYRQFRTAKGYKHYFEDLQHIEGLFVICNQLKKNMIGFGVDGSKIHIINMTVDPSRFEGLKKLAVKERYIAYCGTVSNNKDGVNDLIRSFAIVAQKIDDVKLYIIGSYGKKKDAENNLKLIKEYQLEGKIVLTGKVASNEMPQLLKNAEALVLARPDNLQAQNGFPTKLGEYLMTENPVIVTRTSDIPLFLEDGVSALLAEPGNIEEIAKKTIWALEHPDECISIGQRGAEVARKSFNSDIEARKIYDIMVENQH